MIAKILFLALVGVAYVQGGLLGFPKFNRRFADDKDALNQLGDKSLIIYDEGTNAGEEETVVENLEGLEGLENHENENANANDDFNDLYEFHIEYDRPEENEQVATLHVEEANDNAHEMHTHHPVSPIVTEKTPYANPVTEHTTRQPSVDDFFDVFGQAINEVVNENAHNFNNEVGSVLEIGKSVVDAAKTIADAKIKLANSFPRIGMKVLDAWGKK